MSQNDLTKDDTLELLEKTRFELNRCQKSLAFKENLLIELEFEVSDLTRRNQQLQKDIACKRRQELLGSSSEAGNSTDEDDPNNRRQSWSPESLGNIEVAGTKTSVAACEGCRLSDIEKSDLLNVIEELHDQKERLSDVNQRLLENLNSKSEQRNLQLAEVAADASKEKALRRTLEASLEFLTVEKELVERDLKDFRECSLPFSRLSGVVNDRGASLGSSIGEELGLGPRAKYGERKFSLPPNWNVDIQQAGITCFEHLDDLPIEDDGDPSIGDPSLPAGRSDSMRDVQSEQTKKKRKHGETYETLSENESEDDSEDEPTDKKTPAAPCGWRALMCLPYRRFIKRRRL